MGHHRLSDLIEVEQIRHLLEFQFRITGMPIGIIDAEGELLAGMGWQEICTRFHRVQPESLAHCKHTETSAKAHHEEIPRCRRCPNGLQEVAIPILVGGEYMATLFLGQFLFKDETLDRERFRAQANAYGFDLEDYFRCLDKVPRFTWAQVEDLVDYTRNLVLFLAERGLASLKIQQETKERIRIEQALRETTLELDRRVQERTQELRKTNLALQEEVETRRKAETALLRSERLYRTLFESANDAIFLMKDDRFVECNSKTIEMFGFSREEILDHPPYAFSPPLQPDGRDSRQEAIKQIQRAYEGNPQLFEWTHLQRDGRTFDAEVSLNRIECGGEWMLLAIVRDITDRKRAEKALRDSEEDYRQLFEAESDALFLIENETGKILQANTAACELYGYTREEMLTKRNTDLSAEPQDTRRVTTTTPIDLYQVVRIPLRFHRKHDGTVFPVEMTGRFFEHGGRPVHIVAIRDITERMYAQESLRESEERYRHVVEDQTEIIARFYPDGTLTFVNDVCCRYFGKHPSEMLGRSWQPEVVAEDVSEVRQKLSTLSPENPVIQIENRVRKPNGEIHWMQFVNRGRFNPDGTLKEIQAVGRDITERKRLEQALSDMERITARGQMAAYIAHEINNPLAGIKNSFLLLEDAIPADHPRRSYVQLIKREIDRISGIIRMIYRLYKPYPAEERDIALIPVFQDIRDLLLSQCKSRGLEIAFEAEEDLQIRINEGLLRQVLFNLTQNAMEASPQGGTITLGASREDGQFTIYVRDEGMGVPEEYADRIFEAGFTTKQNSSMSGLGLGLATCKNIVESLGGVLEFAPAEQGRGTVFRMQMPHAYALTH